MYFTDDFDINQIYSKMISNIKTILQSVDFTTLQQRFFHNYLDLGDLFHLDLSFKLQLVKSLDEMYNVLEQSPYFNWFDTRLLQALVNASGLNEAKECLEHFKATYYKKEILAYVTGFAKRDLPHTSNFINLEDHNFVIKRQMKLKLSPAIKQCWYFLLTKFQVHSVYQSEVTNLQSL